MHPLLGIRKELRHSTGNEKSVNILLDLLCSFEKGKQTPQKFAQPEWLLIPSIVYL